MQQNNQIYIYIQHSNGEEETKHNIKTEKCNNQNEIIFRARSSVQLMRVYVEVFRAQV